MVLMSILQVGSPSNERQPSPRSQSLEPISSFENSIDIFKALSGYESLYSDIVPNSFAKRVWPVTSIIFQDWVEVVFIF